MATEFKFTQPTFSLLGPRNESLAEDYLTLHSIPVCEILEDRNLTEGELSVIIYSGEDAIMVRYLDLVKGKTDVR